MIFFSILVELKKMILICVNQIMIFYLKIFFVSQNLLLYNKGKNNIFLIILKIEKWKK